MKSVHDDSQCQCYLTFVFGNVDMAADTGTESFHVAQTHNYRKPAKPLLICSATSHGRLLWLQLLLACGDLLLVLTTKCLTESSARLCRKNWLVGTLWCFFPRSPMVSLTSQLLSICWFTQKSQTQHINCQLASGPLPSPCARNKLLLLTTPSHQPSIVLLLAVL